VGRPLKKKLDPKIIQQKKYVEKMYKMVSTFKLSHYPVLPDSIAINWGVHPPTSIESTSRIKMTLYRI
jgi:hypothetical protein